MKHIMLDMETLGTSADAVIMSIGAVRFDLESDSFDDAGFYSSVSIESNLGQRRRIDEDTLLWWLKRPAAAQAVFHEPKVTLHEALTNLSDWVGDKDHCVWSNGADFDIPMVAHAFKSFGMETPWEFWNSRCFRTYKSLPGAKAVADAIGRAGVHHNALHDALHQVKVVQAVHAKLFPKTTTKAKQ